MNQPKESNWRNWSDHPIIVGISLTAVVLTAIFTIWALTRVRDSHNLSDSEKSSVEAVNEAVNKSPKELVDWYRSIKDDLERKRQAKTLFYGRKITVAGQPDIYVVFEDSFNFALPQFYGHVNLKDMSVEAVTNSQVFVFVCRIGRIDEKAVYGSDCRVEKY